MTFIYPNTQQRQDYHDNDEPYCCCFDCPDAKHCNPVECELLQQEMIELEREKADADLP